MRLVRPLCRFRVGHPPRPRGAGAGESVPDPSAPGTSAAGATNGGSLVATSGDGTVAHLSLANWKVLGQSDNMEDELLSCCVLKNGKKCVTGSQTGMLNIFSYGEWEDFSDRFPGHPSSIDAIVKVDEETILTGSSDGIVRVISILPNKMLGIVGEHGDMPLERMALREDHSLLATASHDKTIKLWDVKYLWETDPARGRRRGGDGGPGRAGQRRRRQRQRRGRRETQTQEEGKEGGQQGAGVVAGARGGEETSGEEVLRRAVSVVAWDIPSRRETFSSRE